MRGRCGGEVSETVCAGSGDGDADLAKQREGDWVIRDTNSNGVEARSHQRRDRGLFGKNKRERTGPEAPRERLGLIRPIPRNDTYALDPIDMHDQRAGGWAALRFENSRDGIRVQGIRPESIDSFGWKGY